MNETNKQLLTLLQQRGDIPIQELAKRVGLSKTACWNRLQNLTNEGIIKRKSVSLDHAKLGYTIKALLLIKTNQHDKKWLINFLAHIQSIPQVISLYRLTGEVDYILEVISEDMQAYNEVYKKLVSGCSIYSVSTAIVMEELHKPIPIR